MVKGSRELSREKERRVSKRIGILRHGMVVMLSLCLQQSMTPNRSLCRLWTGLAALGDAAEDGLVLDIVGVVGLDVGGEAVERTLQGVLGGGIHHAGLSGACQLCLSVHIRVGEHTYCGASSGTQEMKATAC